MGLSIGIAQTIEQACEWQELNSLISQVLADSAEDVTSLFTVAPPWVVIIDDQQILQYTSVSFEDSTAEILISVLDTLWIPELGVSADEIDFGQAAYGETVEFELTVGNSRTGVLELISATVDNPVFTVDYVPGEIFAVDDSVIVTIAFAPDEIGNHEGTLTIESSAGSLDIPVSGICGSADVSSAEPVTPEGFKLLPIYPNPFNSNAVIEFHLPYSTTIQLNIYNIQGKAARELYSGQASAGIHRLEFEGRGLTSGIYYCSLQAAGFSSTEKFVFIK
ncbi:MAG: T9SS type A sorting domain-containing protein [FCB group bacterium]|nr:T9SS type A sorting domain-containing protein [FCB group bacterium]